MPSTAVLDLEPDLLAALTGAGVQGAGADIDGTAATVHGVVPSAQAQEQAVTAAGAVDGVTEVIDELSVVVPVTDQLNALFELAPIQFAEGDTAEAYEANRRVRFDLLDS